MEGVFFGKNKKNVTCKHRSFDDSLDVIAMVELGIWMDKRHAFEAHDHHRGTLHCSMYLSKKVIKKNYLYKSIYL